MDPPIVDIDSDVLISVVEHVFLPPKLPQQAPIESAEYETNVAFCHILIQAARAFSQYLSPARQLMWDPMIKMIETIDRTARAPLLGEELEGALSELAVGGVFAMHVRAQNAAVVVRVLLDHVRFEIFEVSPPAHVVVSAERRLLCSYPGPAIQVSPEIFFNEYFLQELASFLVEMDIEVLDSTPTTVKAGCTVSEVCESADPRYISKLLVGILRGFGQPASVDRITKRIGDEALLKSGYKPWRRSPLWLVVRVTLQTSLDSDTYKMFILFFHAYLVHICVQKGFPRGFTSETLHFMRAKMARRLSKIGPSVSVGIYDVVYRAAKETETLLQERWSNFQRSRSVSRAWRPEELDVVSDSVLTLDNSHPYLVNALHSTHLNYLPKQFSPSHRPRLANTTNFVLFSGGGLAAAVAEDNRAALADFELSVERYLDNWVDAFQHNSNAPEVIASCIDQYFSMARNIYGANSEDNSVMILTVLDLWMALDKLTLLQCPLLGFYSPEIPKDFLHPLLLHRSGSLQRATLIEEYIIQRHERASHTTSIFSDDVTESSFAVQYFRASQRLQQLYVSISQRDSEQQIQKLHELDSLNIRWQSLSGDASRMSHTCSVGMRGARKHQQSMCQKCLTEHSANSLMIQTHEWPLPQDPGQIQSVIFELSPPRAFSTWREITYKILHDIGTPDAHVKADRPILFLDTFFGLKPWTVRHSYHRITIASTSNSFRDQSHFKAVRIPAHSSQVILNNGPSFKLFDRNTNSWVGKPFCGSTIANFCTPPIHLLSTYNKIHSFASGTDHTSNEVIAAQADCPPELRPHEYMAFSTLRSGPRLQWLNIARELSSPSLSFRREEVHTLITQAAWHLGPLLDGVREWHTDIGIPSFGRTLLHELEGLLGRIEANWLEEVTVRTIALLTSRLVSSAVDPDICQRAFALLRRARNVAHNWISDLDSKLETTDDETARTNLRGRLCILAATCFSTYDVCANHVPWTLSSDSDIAIAMRCAVIVHDNTPSILTDDGSHYLIQLLNRHRRLLHFLEPTLRECVQSMPSGFDRGVASLWPGFRRQTSSNWHVLPSPNSRWISCIVEGGYKVHYNLLTGQLLIGGNPFGRLPQEIVKHVTYASVLGNRVPDVVPANIPSMELMTRSSVSGYQILFSLRDGDLTLRARRLGDSRLLQFIPRSVFVDDFPKAFVDDCVHWLDLSTGEVEFRPVESPWAPDPSNWRLTICSDDTRSMFRKISGDSSTPAYLIDIRSATFQAMSHMLSALELPEYIVVTHTNQALEASLSRLRLVFFINHNAELECRSMPGYVIDEFQSCGTMFGLKNQLVLRPSNSSSEIPRRVIIPQGNIKFGLDGDFTSVSIETETARHVHWHEYTVDTDLGRLTGNVSLRSKLYQCYLHALTSHCLPDPLLGHTGTEESLNMLQSAAFLSFQRLGKDDTKLLGLINNLTPSRVYYPPHLKTTVTVEWNNLPIFSQHHDFHPAVLSILDHARAMEALNDKPVFFDIPRQEASLLIRAASRNKECYPRELQNLRHSYAPISEDVVYESRDIASGQDDEHTACQMSWSAWNNRPCLSRSSLRLWETMQSWKSIGPVEEGISLRSIQYWLTFNPAKNWFQIYNFCQEALDRDPKEVKIRLAFNLSVAGFRGTKYVDILPLVLIFATDTIFRDIELPHPSEPDYVLSDGTYPNRERLETLMSESQYARPLKQTQQTRCGKRVNKRKKKPDNRPGQTVSQAVDSTMRRWPKISCKLSPQRFDVEKCLENVDAYRESILQNVDFRDYIHYLEGILEDYYEDSICPEAPYHFSPHFGATPPKASYPSLRDLLTARANYSQSQTPQQPSTHCVIPSIVTIVTESNPPSTGEDGLSSLIQEFRHAQESLLRLYGEDLDKSYGDLLEKRAPLLQRGSPPLEALRRYRDLCSEKKDAIFSEISEALAPSQRTEAVLHISGLFPRITPRSILRELSKDRVHPLTDQWKHAIIRYAVAFLKCQQSQRLFELSSSSQEEELLQEAETSCEEVAASCSPDWLLVQIDSNFLARPLQLAIAREMISPTCKRSASLQLHMGEGKSSVIVPLVAATLADGSNLARIVTLKPSSNQTYQLLLSRLSGLTDRRIFYVPFSQNLQMSVSVVQGIRALYRSCAIEGGVLVTQPEYLLSQKLMCINSLLASHDDHKKISVANELKSLHDWQAEVSRDVLDDSNEILHVRYQLVYTQGEQMPVQDHPNRWTTIQQVFSRLRTHAAQLHANFPKKFELDQTEKGFPIMRILDQEVSQRISQLITEDALGGALSTLSFALLSPSVREATRRFIVQKEISDDDHQLIRSRCAGTTLWSGILLLRGFLVDGEGILSYVLKDRRWRVDYGLDPSRTLLAVPYRAKDVPSLRAEFGHPDVAIALTCLSYYYDGLTRQQVLQCIDLLTKLDNPDMEYDQWIEIGEGTTIPMSLRQVNGINTNDDTQVDDQLVPLFSRNTRVIHFYLSKVVFPRAAREFPSKLPTSSWDLVEEKRKNVTTGFSGTNDNRYLLPTSITHEDPESQLCTNALALQYILRSENDHYECTEGINGERESAEAFLRRLVRHEPEIRVLLDVGAQMLELQNEALARYWLTLKPHISAAIFFSELDHLTVLTQDGMIEPFISSPFNRQLDKCIVYLDDAHTRGTDLKLPRGSRAAVTLGPKVTKDKLIQGCMRMRQLGKGQSVMFFAPGEVDRRIRCLIPQGQESENDIRATDILRWAMHETCRDIAHHISHWAQQGVDHYRRSSAYKQYSLTEDPGALRNSWLQPDSKTLEEMYEPVSRAQCAVFDPEINSISSLRERLALLGATRLIDVRVAEEQEREVLHKVELPVERHLEFPPIVLPATHMVCDEILNFVRTGVLPEPSMYILPLFTPTELDEALNLMEGWSPTPLATREFAVTTTNSSISRLTDYLRPVNWILSSGSGSKSTAIVISPYEANELLPIIRKSGKVRLHIYAPRITSSMRSFSDLTFYSIPESPEEWAAPMHLRTELNLFAGQLYFDDENEYRRVCVFLALHMAHPGARHIEADGFVPPAHRTGQRSPLIASAIATLKRLTGLRTKGQGFGGTDLGRVLDARPLSSELGSWVRE